MSTLESIRADISASGRGKLIRTVVNIRGANNEHFDIDVGVGWDTDIEYRKRRSSVVQTSQHAQTPNLDWIVGSSGRSASMSLV